MGDVSPCDCHQCGRPLNCIYKQHRSLQWGTLRNHLAHISTEGIKQHDAAQQYTLIKKTVTPWRDWRALKFYLKIDTHSDESPLCQVLSCLIYLVWWGESESVVTHGRLSSTDQSWDCSRCSFIFIIQAAWLCTFNSGNDSKEKCSVSLSRICLESVQKILQPYAISRIHKAGIFRESCSSQISQRTIGIITPICSLCDVLE